MNADNASPSFSNFEKLTDALNQRRSPRSVLSLLISVCKPQVDQVDHTHQEAQVSVR